MGVQNGSAPPKMKTPISVLCEEDPQEKTFDALIRLWVQGEVPYSSLMKNYPDYYSSMIRRFLAYLTEKLS